MPEFWTWWIESGPAIWTESFSPSCDVTIAFVSWSAPIDANATAARPTHCVQRAPGGLSATEVGVRPSVAEPTRTSARRAGPVSSTRSLAALAGSPAGIIGRNYGDTRTRSVSPTLALSLAVDAERRPGPRLEPLDGNWLSTVRADAVRTVVDALQRSLDLSQDVLGVLLERVIQLPVVRHRRGVGEVVVVHGVLTGLVADRSWVLLVQVVDRRFHALPLLQQDVAEAIRIDHAHGCSFRAAAVRRRSTRSESIPVSSTILSRPPCPETSVTASRETDSVSASSRTTSSFAWPPSGRAATRIFQPSPWRPTTPARVAPGDTRRRKRVPFMGQV